ncbi:MAG: hypothetical protein WCG26_05270 [Chloroflexales bacterium]
MLWLSLLVLMLVVAAAPGVSMYVEHVRAAVPADPAESENPRHAA